MGRFSTVFVVKLPSTEDAGSAVVPPLDAEGVAEAETWAAAWDEVVASPEAGSRALAAAVVAADGVSVDVFFACPGGSLVEDPLPELLVSFPLPLPLLFFRMTKEFHHRLLIDEYRITSNLSPKTNEWQNSSTGRREEYEKPGNTKEQRSEKSRDVPRPGSHLIIQR
jgi:hypothetical protein